MDFWEDDQVINRLLIFLLRIMVCATLFAGDGLAANIRISETGRVDGLHNGSIDVDTALTSNMTDERAIVCNFYFEGVVSAGDRNKLLSIMQVWRRAHKLESPRICLNSPGGSAVEARQAEVFAVWIGRRFLGQFLGKPSVTQDKRAGSGGNRPLSAFDRSAPRRLQSSSIRKANDARMRPPSALAPTPWPE
jgi:hypothetical protein